jgi:hypothetical protein
MLQVARNDDLWSVLRPVRIRTEHVYEMPIFRFKWEPMTAVKKWTASGSGEVAA